ncbi:hypothetical protein BDZ85DRAFT_321543 [Elsinoe ampelina]|uniref:Uncharacterized protein n=1 Tax=Elsinoe ampelina TaxID=302913 RepID=A0A6A6G3C4_9PEZI|nr:hypothetical protein BDZ85DRAFT_321543 [Elsinoe ampelina]
MGLPIWRDHEDTSTKDTVRTDPTAAARSSIRRRPILNRHATTRAPVGNYVFQTTHAGSPPPPPAMSPPPPLPVPAPTSSRFIARHVRDRLHTIRSAYQPDTEREGPTQSLERMLRGLRRQEQLASSTGNDSPARRSFLPTPPLDVSEQNEAAQTNAPIPTISVQPATGLGDRVRSPSPMTPQDDAWQIMRESIPVDGNLPSADSSFTSAAASASFTSTADAPDSQSTAPDHLANPDSQMSLGLSQDCPPYDSDSSDARSNSPLQYNPLDRTEDPLYGSGGTNRADGISRLRSELQENLSALQEAHEESLLVYEDEISSLRDDFNSLRERLRHIDPSATLPPPYPRSGLPSNRTASHSASRSGVTIDMDPNNRDALALPRNRFPYPPSYDSAIRSRTRDAVSRTEDYFLPHSRHEPYGQYHLGVDRDGQLQLLPRDRTLTRVPSLRREDSERESHDRVRHHLRERAEGQMREQTRRSLAAAGFTPPEIDRISDPRAPGERLRDEERGRQDLIDEIQERERQRQRDGERTGEDAASDVDSMRGILDRLSRRQDVPEGMWMGAGLSRDVVEPRVDGPIDAFIRVSERQGVRDGQGATGRDAGNGRVAGRGSVGRVPPPS